MIKGIHHISMKTSSDEQYAKVRSFYVDTLMLSVVIECDKCLLLDTGSGIVEIFKNAEDDLSQGVIRHFALSTDNVDECVSRVKDDGYEVFIEPKEVKVGGDERFPARIAFCRGPLGEEIEFFSQGW